jgi:OmpA-OmpF porin, OOP family
VSKSANIAQKIVALSLCGLSSACTLQATMSAGTRPRSPEEPPANAESAPSEAAAAVSSPKSKANVKVNGAKLEVPGSVAFETDSAQFAANSGTEAVLAEVKAYLDQSPRVTRLRIEGHTSNVRSAEQSLQLSGQRARAVKTWLQRNGIHDGRLVAVGFGDTQPVASNADPAGQAQNERIAFRIAELDGKPYLGADPLAGGTEFP